MFNINKYTGKCYYPRYFIIMIAQQFLNLIFIVTFLLIGIPSGVAQTIPSSDLEAIQRQQEHIERQNEISRNRLEIENKNRSASPQNKISQEETLLLPESEKCFIVEDMSS